MQRSLVLASIVSLTALVGAQLAACSNSSSSATPDASQEDSQSGEDDSGTVDHDSGKVEKDSGKVEKDSGQETPDSGEATDGGSGDDAADDGSVSDDGSEPSDGGIVVDTGVEKDGAVKDGAVKDGAAEDGAAKDGAAEDGAVKDGATVDGTSGDSAASDGATEAGCAAGESLITVYNFKAWCEIKVGSTSVPPGTLGTSDAMTVCAAPGATVEAVPNGTNFELGTLPLPFVSGTTGGVDGTSSATATLGTGKTCISLCCPFSAASTMTAGSGCAVDGGNVNLCP